MRSILGGLAPSRILVVALWIAFVACVSSIYAQPAIVVRELSKPDAQSASAFGNIFSVHQLNGGRVLVNDGIRRQLVVLDDKLANPVVVIDSIAEGGAQAYGPRAAPIIPHLGDSTLFPDPVSRTLVLIDPDGKIARVIAAPKATDFGLLMTSSSGVDNNGNLVYRGMYPAMRSAGAENAGPAQLDSAPLLRANFATRVVDTVGRIKIVPLIVLQERKSADGKIVLTSVQNPYQTIDNWTILSNGTVAIVRGHDYHVDFVQPDQKLFSAPKLPYDFRRLTDDEKQRFVDSAVTRNRAGYDSLVKAAVAANRRPLVIMVEYVPIAEMADYYPPFRAEATKADADGNLWILPTTSAQSKSGELVYDIVNSHGVLTERVRVAAGRSIAGFGKGGIVYLMSKRNDNQWILERTKRLITSTSPQ